MVWGLYLDGRAKAFTINSLREKGIVRTRREGVTIYYSLSNPKIIKAFDIIREVLY